MAIIPMKKISIAVSKTEVDSMMKALQKWGLVHISMSEREGLDIAADDEKIAGVSEELERVKEALSIIKRYDTSKAPAFAAAPTITPEEYEALQEKREKLPEIYQAVSIVEKEIAAVKSKISKANAKIEVLLPFEDAHVPMHYQHGTKRTWMSWGFMPHESIASIDQLKAMDGVLVESYKKYGMLTPMIIAAHKSKRKEIKSILKDAGYVEARIEEGDETAAKRIAQLRKYIQKDQKVLDKLIENAASAVEYKADMLVLEDYLTNELAREASYEQLWKTQKVCVIEGYIRHYDEQKISSIVDGVTNNCYYQIVDVEDEDEQVPTACENKAIVEPFEAVTEMYSIPSRKTIDANALMMPFYFIFFGMMLSDAAYGIILALGSIFYLKMKKPEGGFKKILTVLAICGVSTLIWGLLFGSWIGVSTTPLLFNPLETPLPMLVLCLGIGVAHLMAGLFMGAYINVKRKKTFAAIFDQGSWIIILAAIPVIVISTNVGLAMMLAAALMLIVSQGRDQKGVGKKIMGGVKSLYGVTGYISDILSYARIFGMALATGVIAMVFNTIAGMLATSIPGFIFAAVVFLIGHVFNIGINALGSYVHSSRLQYIEFFSKFFEGGGIRFEPLRVRMSNMRMQKK